MIETKDYFIKLPEVMRRSCLGRSTVFARVKDKTFPPQIKLSPRTSVWSSDAVSAWIEEQKETLDQREE